MAIFGWDASDFDWDRGARPQHVTAAAKEGISFFTHKITESTHTIHFHAGEMVRAAIKAGIQAVGFYVVPRTPGASIEAQVDFAIKEANRQMPEWKSTPGFFWQVDLEHWGYDNVAPRYGIQMCDLLEVKTTKKCLLYAPKWAYGDSIPTTGGYPLWASSYGSNPQTGFKDAYARAGGDNHQGWGKYSGRTPVILQYGSDTVIGGQHTCDANAFRGTLQELLDIVAPKRQTEEDAMKTVLVAVKGDNRVFLSDGITRVHVADHDDTDKVSDSLQVLKDTVYVGADVLGSLVDRKVRYVDNLDAFGKELPPNLPKRLKELEAKLDQILALLQAE